MINEVYMIILLGLMLCVRFMYNQNSKQSNNLRQIASEKIDVIDMYRRLSSEHNESRNQVSGLYYELNKKQLMLLDDSLDVSKKSMLKYDVTLTKKELEKAIHHKELLNKDLTLLQHRIKYLENEIRKTQPWWQKLFDSVR